MLTRKMFSSANLCEYDVKQRLKYRLNIVVRCYELNCSFYNADSSNYKRNTIRIFRTYQKNTLSSLRLICRIKNNPKLLQRSFLFIVNHANKAC